MLKRICAVMALLLLLLSGCSGAPAPVKNGAETGGINARNERLVKEFAGIVNIFYRFGDELVLSAEEGEFFNYYEIGISSSQARESALTDMEGRYIYYEPIGDKGFIAVEELEGRNTLKFIGRDNVEKVIAEDIGEADAINISISPQAGKIAYTSLSGGEDIYDIHIHDMETWNNHKLMDIRSHGLIEGFSHMVNWSPDENNVIISDRYIYDTNSGLQKGELKSSYSVWSTSGSRIAFILDDDSQQWLSAEDYYIYPGKKVCVYDLSKGSYNEVLKLEGDEYVFGNITWSGNDRMISFPGVKVDDMHSADWYMKLNYSSVYLVEPESGKSKRLETNADASDGTMIELGNIKFSNQGSLLSFTVGNYENSRLFVVNTETLESKTFESIEYLHWIDGENYSVASGQDYIYFCSGNSIIQIDAKLQESTVYKSKTMLDDFYISRDGKGMLIFELQEDVHTARYIGE